MRPYMGNNGRAVARPYGKKQIMRIQHYIKSAWQHARTDRLFTGIYITGVTLAIATTLTMAIIYNIKLSPIYPEVNRNDTYFILTIIGDGDKRHQQSNHTYSVAKLFRNIDGVKAAGVYSSNSHGNGVLLSDGVTEEKVVTKQVDDGFFKICEFNFIEGEPFTQEDIEGNVKEVIITDDLAALVFGKGNEALGKTIKLNYKDYRVKGVVEAASTLFDVSYSQIYLPAVVTDQELTGDLPSRVFGGYMDIMLIEEGKKEAVKEEISKRLAAFAEGTDWQLKLPEAQPLSHVQNTLRPYAQYFDWWSVLKDKLLILLVLLIVPAVNLAGLISGRMDARVGELGLRKAFGAKDGDVMKLIVSENLVYTFIGGMSGLVIASAVVLLWTRQLFNMMNSTFGSSKLSDSMIITFRPEMFFSLKVFGLLLAVCLILNVLSAIVPAWISMRRSIVESINEKE